MRPVVSKRWPRGHWLLPEPASPAAVVGMSGARLSTGSEAVVATYWDVEPYYEYLVLQSSDIAWYVSEESQLTAI